MKRILTFLLLLVSGMAFNQMDSIVYRQQVDSILATPLDSNQVESLNDLAWKGKYINLEITQRVAEYNVAAATELGRMEDAAFAWKLIGIIHDEKGRYVESIDAYMEAIKIYESLNDSMGVAKCEANTAMIYRNMKKYDVALDYFNKSLETFKAYDFAYGQQLIYANIGICYMDMKATDSAEFYYNKAADIMHANGSHDPDIYGNLGLIYSMTDRMPLAAEYLEKCINLIETYAPNDLNLKVWYQNLGAVYLKLNKVNEALEVLNKAIEKTGSVTYTREMTYLLRTLADAYERKGDYKKANAYLYQLVEVKDSIFSSDNLAQINDVKEKYETEKKQLQIEKLDQEHKLELFKREQEEQKNVYFSIGLGVAVLILILVSVGFVFKIRDNRLIKNQNLQIENQRLSLQQKNEEILSSIVYAKRIQTAILPPDKLVKEYLNESFIFYRPKDIVAGDFYWMDKRENTLLFAVADCTGHGVPGALVSVVCHNALNRSVREFGLLDPAKILDKTRELIAEQFAKSEENVRDGMDIALVAINYNQQDEVDSVLFSGANNPLWLVRNKDIIELKGMKQPVGLYEGMKPFESLKVDLQKGDVMYLFSDGYGDQFGGAQGKKFKSGSLKKLLADISDAPMSKQRSELETVFDSWKGELEQLDDICIIGVRI